MFIIALWGTVFLAPLIPADPEDSSIEQLVLEIEGYVNGIETLLRFHRQLNAVTPGCPEYKQEKKDVDLPATQFLDKLNALRDQWTERFEAVYPRTKPLLDILGQLSDQNLSLSVDVPIKRAPTVNQICAISTRKDLALLLDQALTIVRSIAAAHQCDTKTDASCPGRTYCQNKVGFDGVAPYVLVLSREGKVYRMTLPEIYSKIASTNPIYARIWSPLQAVCEDAVIRAGMVQEPRDFFFGASEFFVGAPFVKSELAYLVRTSEPDQALAALSKACLSDDQDRWIAALGALLSKYPKNLSLRSLSDILKRCRQYIGDECKHLSSLFGEMVLSYVTMGCSVRRVTLQDIDNDKESWRRAGMTEADILTHNLNGARIDLCHSAEKHGYVWHHEEPSLVGCTPSME